MTYDIELPADQHEGEQYRDWLIAQGHSATIGRTTATTIKHQGQFVEDADTISNQLWNDYCAHI